MMWRIETCHHDTVPLADGVMLEAEGSRPVCHNDTDFILNDATLLLYDPCVRYILLPNGVQTNRESRPDLQEGRS